MAEMRIVTREELIEEVKDLLANPMFHTEPITYEDFVADGVADRLTDAYHRDLWLSYRDFILDL